MLATEVTENTDVFSFVGAASAANLSRSDGLFAAEAAPTFTVVQIKTTKQNKHLPLCLCGKTLSYQPTKSGEDPLDLSHVAVEHE